MTFSVTIGTKGLPNFARLNVAYLRKIFGDDTPICLYDSPSDSNEEIAKIASEYSCAYFCDRIDKGHFGGDLQAAIVALALGKEHKCDIAIKLNQRLILLDPEIPKRLKKVFSDERVTFANSARYPVESIIQEESKFHGKFPATACCLVFRTSKWDGESVASRYHEQWTSLKADKYSTYTEVFWANEIQRIGPEAYRPLDWLSRHESGKPFKFLRKMQNTPADYGNAAAKIGLPVGGFQLRERQHITDNYSPAPRA